MNQGNDLASCDGLPVEHEGGSVPQTSVRAFAQGTGVLLQVVGMFLFMFHCCVWSLIGLWEPIQDRSKVIEQISDGASIGVTVSWLWEHPSEAGQMLMVVAATVGGLGLAGFGLGMQADKARSATGALVTSGLMLVMLAMAGLGLWRGQGWWLGRIWHGVLIAVNVGVMGFCWAALMQVRQNPPIAGAEVLSKDYKIPYSMYHDDSPEQRLANELAGRRAKLEAEQRELERLERELKDREEG